MVTFLMSLPLWLKAALMGVVEGLTEFLPISSTGHLILAGSLLGFDDAKAQVFDVVIQTGAILAVVWEFRARLFKVARDFATEAQAQRFVFNVAIAFMPLAVLGLLFGKFLKAHLFKPVPVAAAFIVGALVILWAERRGTTYEARVTRIEDMTFWDALKVGIAQAFALIPGTSRSGATIIGGMLFGLSRQVATEFTFFLAIPTLMVAGAYDLIKHRDLLNVADVPMFAVGLLTSFISAFVCVRWLLRYVASHNFVPFAWYRIVFGLIVLVTAWTGVVEWSV